MLNPNFSAEAPSAVVAVPIALLSLGDEPLCVLSFMPSSRTSGSLGWLVKTTKAPAASAIPTLAPMANPKADELFGRCASDGWLTECAPLELSVGRRAAPRLPE